MNTIAIVQARLASERLPGKVLEEIGGFSPIEHVVARAGKAGLFAIVACPASDADEIQASIKDRSVRVFGWDGAPEDVLGRFAALAEDVNPESRPLSVARFVRLTADCPFVDTEGIWLVSSAVGVGAADYATTNPGGGQLRIDGYDAEAFTRELLMAAHDNAITKYDREHVTPWIRREAKQPWTVYRQPPFPKALENLRALAKGFKRETPSAILEPSGPWHHRWTLDTPEDLAWFRAVAEEIDVTPPQHPTYEELMALLERRPDLVRTAQ